jgi:sRNA-binding carbon storage regulator CsrA
VKKPKSSEVSPIARIVNRLGLTAPEFVDLRRIEVQKEIVQHSPSALTVIMGLERVGINMPPLAS